MNVAASVYVVEGLDESGNVVSVASAVAIDKNAVVTNKHAINAGGSLRVRQAQSIWPAAVDKLDEKADLAILRIDGLSTAVPPELRSVDSLTIGERVFAIGAPYGLELSLSEGLIAGLRHRGHEQDIALVQTTAPISKGSSGGGLFDARGHLVGVTTFYLSGAQNLNFAIACDRITNLRQQTADGAARAWAAVAGEIADNAASVAGLEAPPAALDQLNDWADRMKPRTEAVTRERKKAVRAYTESLRLNPNDAAVWANLGGLYAWLDEPRKTISAFDRALRLHPEDISILTKAAESYDHLNDRSKAAQVFRDAIQLQPANADLWVGLADVLSRTDSKESAKALEQAQQLRPSSALVWTRIGLRYQYLNRYANAEAAFREATRVEPNDVLSWKLLGNFYIYRHNKRKFQEACERLRRVDPQSADSLERAWR